MTDKPLSRDEICSVIEGRGAASRIPNLVHLWVHPQNFGADEAEVHAILERYPLDVQRLRFRMPDLYSAPSDAPEYRWVNYDAPIASVEQGLDERVVIQDWNQLDSILANFPDWRYAGLFPDNPVPDGRYRVGMWFFCLFERMWSLRGMTNALMDFYTDPEQVHRLFDALTTFYCGVIRRAKAECNIDGIFTSDDLGTQKSTFFSPELFDEFFAPYYKRMIDAAHEVDVHFWLHTCGNVVSLIPRFINLGLDVIHPIQKYTMSEKEIADKYGKDICIWAGFDVQQIIPWGTLEQVRAEVRFMIDTYYRPEGRFMLTAGNGVNQDCPLASLEALMNEIMTYGQRFKRIEKTDA